ncbi:MAG: PAS domain S-box protein, partial [Planctomycetes bacterium]|nr:PAS domain S-box protein [Planctomycetota bacterium]
MSETPSPPSLPAYAPAPGGRAAVAGPATPDLAGLLGRLLEVDGDAVVLADATQRIIYVNPVAVATFGYSPDEILGQPLELLVPPPAREHHRERVAGFIRGPVTALSFADRPCLLAARKDGARIPVEISVCKVEAGGQLLLAAFVRDVAERTRAAAQRAHERELLRVSEERFRLLADNAQDIVYLRRLVPTPRMEYISPAVARILGYSPEELIADPGLLSRLAHPEDRSLLASILDGAEGTETTRSLRYRHRDGHWVWAEGRRSLIRDAAGRPVAVHGIVRDVSERERAEQESRLLQAVMLQVERAYDFDSTVGAVLRQICAATGWVYGEVWTPSAAGLHLECHPAWHGDPEALREFRAVAARETFARGHGLPGRVWQTGKSEWMQELTPARGFLRAEPAAAAGLRSAVALPVLHGREVIAVLVFLLAETREEDARLLQLVSIVSGQLGGLVRRKQIEDEQRALVRRQALVAELGHLALRETELDLVFDRAVSAAARGLDAPLATILELLPDGSALRLRAGRGWKPGLVGAALVSLGRESQAGYTLGVAGPVIVEDFARERRFTAPPILIDHAVVAGVSVPIVGPGGAYGVLGVHATAARRFSPRDVHFLESIANILGAAIGRRRAEQELREGHARLERALVELRAAEQHVIKQERMRALGQLASGIAHDFNNSLSQVLGFTDLILEAPQLLDNRAKTLEYLNLVRTAAGDAAAVVARLREFHRERGADEVFLPVRLNALVAQVVLLTQPRWKDQALAGGRTIQIVQELGEIPLITGGEAELREALTNLVFNAEDALPKGGVITLRTRMGDRCVLLEVADTGSGMTEEVRKRCLDPFFTTKGERGTGLGLSMVYGVIQRHEGAIEIASEPGRGTTFTLRFPFRTATRMLPAVEGGASAQQPALRILVVEDEEAIRYVLAEYLKMDGHLV